MSKLRANEIVNRLEDGSPNFPYGATTPVPTSNDQFANKSYTDSAASTVSSDIKNTISSTPPESPLVGHFWTDTSKPRISLKIWNGDSWVFLKNSRERFDAELVSPPTIINPNLSNPSGFVKIIPTMLTRQHAVVNHARFIKSQWYKDGVAIAQHTDSDEIYYVTEVGTYKYEETWVDDFGVELLTSETMVINAETGTINEQPIMVSTNGSVVPTTLNVTRPTVSDATYFETKWYKNDEVIPNQTGLGLSLPKLISEIGTYRYEEIWIDEFGSPVVPSVSLEIGAPRIEVAAEAVMSSSDGIYYPTTLTVARPVVLEAEFVEAKWYKDDVEIPGETGVTLQATEMATYRYEETWVDMYGDTLSPGVGMFISARDGVIDAQPVITDPKSHLSAPQTLPVVSIIPTTLTASRPTVSHAVFSGSKWYKDGVEIPGATGVELSVSELGTYKYEETWVDEFAVQLLPSQSIVIHANTGVINSPPVITDSNGGYIPTSMTAASASVSDSTLTSSKWYKDDVEISGETGSTYYTSEMGTYKYEEVWVDDLGNVLTTSTTSVITAHAGVIDAQPTLASSDGTYYPTTLTVSRPTVSNHVTYLGSKWYKDDVEISGATGFEYEATEMAVYKYEETWVDIFGTQLKPTVSANIVARAGVVDSQPSISNPQAGKTPIIPTTLGAGSPTVSHATFVESKWYKDGVEITASAGLQFLYVTELGTYTYEETWVDEYGTQLFPSLSTIIDANSGSVNSQPTISDSNSGYIPTTLTAEASEVVNAEFVSSKWYKDGVEISGETGSVLQVGSTSADMGTYKYEETWIDALGTQFTPSSSVVITARPSAIDALPAISSSNGSFYPTTLTATQATVANASFVGSKWYKNGADIPGATGFEIDATEMAEYRYQETWVDLFGSQISARAEININARPGVIDSEVIISNPRAGSTPIIPTTLTATRPTVSHADFVSSRWYKDGSLIADATGLELSVLEVGSYKYEEIWIDEYGTVLAPSLTSVVNADAGSVDVPPSITSSDGIYYPTTLTGVSPVVTNANYVSSQWYKDDVAISGATGSTYEATEMATYKYEETWADDLGTQLFPSTTMFVSARDGSIDSQPTIDSSNGTYYPTTLTATRPTVSHAVFSGSKWYKNGVAIPGSTAANLVLQATEMATYKYEETWVDEFGVELLPSLSIDILARPGVVDSQPSIANPQAGSTPIIPTTLTATRPTVSHADFVTSKWYKDDVEILGATGVGLDVTELGVYKYEEVWVDEYGTQLLPSFISVVHADAGSIDVQPNISDSNGGYIPTTLTVTRPTVSNADFSESKWYKDGTLITETYSPQTSSIVNVVDKSVVGGSWNTHTPPVDYPSAWTVFDVASSPSTMVAVGIVNHGSWSSGTGDSVDANKKIIYSNDGVNWNFATTAITGNHPGNTPGYPSWQAPQHVVYSSNHNRFVAVCSGDIGHITGHRSADLIHYSSNGSSWSQASAPGGFQLFSLAVSSGGQFVATGRGDGDCLISSNGTSWSQGGSMGTTNSTHWGAGLEAGNGVFIAVGGVDAPNGRDATRSTDGGSSWTSFNLPQGPHWVDLATDDAGTWVVGGTNKWGAGATSGGNFCAYSTDNGQTWSEIASSTSPIWKIAYGGGKFVFVTHSAYQTPTYKVCDTLNGGDISDASTWVDGLSATFSPISQHGFAYGTFNNSPTGEVWMSGNWPNHNFTYSIEEGVTSYELELSDNSIDGVFGQTIGDLFTANSHVTGTSGGYGNLLSTADDSTNKMTLVDAGGTWSVGDTVIRTTQTTRPYSSPLSVGTIRLFDATGVSTTHPNALDGNWDTFATATANAKVKVYLNAIMQPGDSLYTHVEANWGSAFDVYVFDKNGVQLNGSRDVMNGRSSASNNVDGYHIFKNETASPINLDYVELRRNDGVQTMPFSAIAIVPESAGFNDTPGKARTGAELTPYTLNRALPPSLDATEMGTYKYEETWTDDIGTQLKPSATSVITAYPGSIDAHPTISDTNGGYIPTVLTATQATVSNATFASSKWTKNGREIAGATGSTYNATEMGKYTYVETWVDAFGTEHRAMRTVNISALPGSVDVPPTITNPKSHLSAPQTLPVVPVIPTTLTATSPTVSNATFVSAQWYKNGSPVAGATGLSLSVTELGIYRYEETWVDAFRTEHKASQTSIIRVNAGFVSTAPSISDSNSGYIPTTLTATRPTVPNATFTGSKWYKDDVEIPGANGVEVFASNDSSSMGTYKYEETWVDDLGTTITTSDSSVITAYAGAISTQPSVSSSNGVYYPSTLTATPATVANANLVGYKWYQDDVEIPGATGLVYQATAMAKYRFEETWVDAFGTQLFPSVSITVVAYAGVIDVLPSISDDNGGFFPSKFIDEPQQPVTLTATRPTVSHASFVESKWYKNNLELTAEAGNLQITVTEMATYRYVETWVDEFGTELTPSSSTFIASPPGEIITQPTISDTNGKLTPTTLTATTAVVKNAAFAGSQWYKDGEAIPSATASTYEATIAGTYKYEETWTDVNGAKTLPSASIVLTPYNVIETPTVLTPADEHGFFSDQFQVKTSDITSVTTTPGGGRFGNLPEYSEWSNLTYGVVNGQGMYIAIARKGTYGISTQQTKYHYRDNGGRYSCNKIAYSYDGVTWYEATVPNDISWTAIAYGEVNGAGRFVAIGATRNILNSEAPQPYDHHYSTYEITDSNAMYSDDGINWIKTGFAGYGKKYHQWQALTYSGGKFFAIARSTASIWTNSLQTSDDEDFLQWGDGSSWNESNISQVNYWQNIGGRPDSTNGNFLAVASQGLYNRSSYTSGGIPKYSTGTKHLCWINPSSSTNQGTGTWLNNSYYGWSAIDMILKDGSKYNNKDHDVYWRDVVYGDNLWVVVSSGGYRRLAYTETTGGAATWNITRTSNDNGDRSWNHITYGEPGGHPMFIIATGYAGNGPESIDIRYATSNGYTGSGHYLDEWKDCILSSTLAVMPDTIQWANDRFVALGLDTVYDKEVLVYSYDGINWVSDYTELVLTDTTVSKVSDGSALAGAEESSEYIFTSGTKVEFPPNIGVTEYWATAFGGDRAGAQAGQDNANDMVIDGDGNVYTIGQHEGRYGGNSKKYDSILTKHNSSGHLEWHRVLGDRYQDYYSWNGNEYTAYRQDYGVGIDLDGAGNIYTMTVSVKTSIDNETPGVVISKYDSSGNMKWQRSLTKPEDKTFDFFREHTGIKVTSNGDVYFMGGTKTVGYENRVDVEVGENTYRVYPESLFIAKYNTSGTLQWQRTMRGGLGDDYDIKDLVLDSSNNAYLFGTAKVANYHTLDEHKFGHTVSTGSGKVVIGSPDNQIRDLSRPGAVYLYDLNGTTLSNEVKISLPEGSTGSGFGRLVKVQSNKIVIADTTQIHIYNLDGTRELSFAPGGDRFPASVNHLAVGGDKIAVYMENDNYTSDDNRYVARIYDLGGNLESTITPPIAVDNGASTTTVTSIAVDGSKIAFGCPHATGAGTDTSLETYLTNPNAVEGDDDYGETLQKGYGYWEDYSKNGAVYVYNLDGTGETIITPSDLKYRWAVGPGNNDIDWSNIDYTNPILTENSAARQNQFTISKYFGTRITIDDGKIAITAPGERPYTQAYRMLTNNSNHNWTIRDVNSEYPAVYVFNLDGTNEVKIDQHDLDTHLVDPGPSFNSLTYDVEFGHSIDMSDGKIVIGAGKENVRASYSGGDRNSYTNGAHSTDSGAVYIYNVDGTNGKRLKNADYVTAVATSPTLTDFDDHLYGTSVALANNKLIVGAPGMGLASHADAGVTPGLAFVYDMNEIQAATTDSVASVKYITMSGVTETIVSAADQAPAQLTESDALFIKYNSSGALQWLRKYDNGESSFVPEEKEDTGAAMAIDDSDNLYTIVHQKYSGKNVIVKQDTSGNILWQRSFKLQYTGVRGLTHTIGDESQEAKNVQDWTSTTSTHSLSIDRQMQINSHFITIDNSGNIIIAMELGTMGYFYNNMYASTIAIIKYDSSGNLLWQRSFGEGTYASGTATVTGVKTDAAGNIYICGSTASFGPNYDSYYLGNTSGRYRSPTYDDDPGASFIAKIPADGSLTGNYGGLPYNSYIAPQGLSYALSSGVDPAQAYIRVVTDLAETGLTHIPDTFIHAEGEMVSARSYMIDDKSAIVRSTKVSFSAPSATIHESSGNNIMLSETTGTWSVGDSLHTAYKAYVKSWMAGTIDPDDPNTLVLVGSAPTATRGSINWGLAEWQLADDMDFTKNVQTLTRPLTGAGAQNGPLGFTLESEKPYYVRARYLSDDQPDVFSEWSETSTFRTNE